MSGGFAVLASCDGLGPWFAVPRSEWEALDIDDVAESIDGLRGGAGRCSGRLDRDEGGMAKGDSGGEVPAEDWVGTGRFRSWAYAEGMAGWVPPRGGLRWAGAGAGG